MTFKEMNEIRDKAIDVIGNAEQANKYSWQWHMSNRDDLSHVLEELEDAGQEIFSIVNMDAPSNFVMIVNRRPR